MPAEEERDDLLAAYDAMNDEQRQALLTMARSVVGREKVGKSGVALCTEQSATGCVVPAPIRMRRRW